MRRVFVTLTAVLGLFAASCGSESVTVGGELLPTAVPAPTLVGEIIELEEPEIQVEAVLIGVPSTETVEVHALPGIDQPLAGDVAPGTAIEPMGQAFETEDGLVWWQVRAGAIQGWIQPRIAYRGAAQDITDQVLQTLGPAATFDSPDEAAQVIAEQVGSEQGASEIVVVAKTEIEGRSSTRITTDLLGLEDDSVLGFRLIIASGPSADWRPASVIQSPLCDRGVTPEGLCL